MRVTRRPPAGLRSLLLAVSVAAALGACSLAETSPAAHLEGLLVLAGDTSGATLQTWAADAHADEGRDVATPDGTAWVAAGRADVLVAGLTDGSLDRDPVDAAGDPDLAWRTVKAAGADGDEVPGPFYFPSWDPEGGRFATLAGDLDAEPRLTLVDPTTQSGFEIELGRPVIAAPPVWVGPDSWRSWSAPTRRPARSSSTRRPARPPTARPALGCSRARPTAGPWLWPATRVTRS